MAIVRDLKSGYEGSLLRRKELQELSKKPSRSVQRTSSEPQEEPRDHKSSKIASIRERVSRMNAQKSQTLSEKLRKKRAEHSSNLAKQRAGECRVKQEILRRQREEDQRMARFKSLGEQLEKDKAALELEFKLKLSNL